MDGYQYCRERVLVPGAELYLIRHFIEPQLVPRLVVLRAFYAEIASIPERVSDSDVARSKLGWWQEEIARCWNGEGRHPISLAAEQHGITRRISRQDLSSLVMAVASWIDAAPLATVDDLLGYCSAIGGMASRLEAQISTGESAVVDTAGQLGTAHYLVVLIRDIGLDARAGRWYIPMDLQARHQVNPQNIAEANDAENFASLVMELTCVASQLLEAATADLAPMQLRQIRHQVIQADLDRKLVNKLASNPKKILQGRLRLAPFQSLFTAWRAARSPGFD